MKRGRLEDLYPATLCLVGRNPIKLSSSVLNDIIHIDNCLEKKEAWLVYRTKTNSIIQQNSNDSNTDGSFTLVDTNLFLCP